jgi:hypothetical protein
MLLRTRGEYLNFCTVFIPLQSRNVMCPCPPGENRGSFECYFGKESEYCFTYECKPRHELGIVAFIGRTILGIMGTTS